MNVNTKGTMLCMRAEIAAMRKQDPKTFTSRNGTRDIGRGAIVNIASAHSFVGLPGKMSYVVSKHANMGLTKMAGLDHSPEGIRCNAVCPSWVRTPLLEADIEKNPEVQAMIEAIVPIKRVAECEEVTDTVVFLCSPAASYINGTSIVIDAAATTTVRLF
jgi:NAD(P)-dependent dehydrogenase (short-subunit alcohol dehydrogenase family)